MFRPLKKETCEADRQFNLKIINSDIRVAKGALVVMAVLVLGLIAAAVSHGA